MSKKDVFPVVSAAGAGFSIEPGRVVSLAPAIADDLIEGGLAVKASRGMTMEKAQPIAEAAAVARRAKRAEVELPAGDDGAGVSSGDDGAGGSAGDDGAGGSAGDDGAGGSPAA